MEVETLLSGTQGEKAHLVYKEEDGNHLEVILCITFSCLLRLCSLSCLAKIFDVVQH